MSGGSYDYISFKIQEIEIRNPDYNPRRIVFQKLLSLVAEAMHDIEWVDSGDTCPGDEHAAIDACFALIGADPTIVVKAGVYDDLKKILGV